MASQPSAANPQSPPATRPATNAAPPAANGARPAAPGIVPATAVPPRPPAPAASAPGTPANQAEQPAEPSQSYIRTLLAATPSWLTSMVLHVVILLILAMISLPNPVVSTLNQLVANAVDEDAENIEEIQIEEPAPDFQLDAAELSETADAAEVSTEPVAVADDPNPTINTAVDLDPIGQVAAIQDVMQSSGSAKSGDLGSQRGDKGRAAAVASRGGNAQSEKAVQMALEWLANHQNPDGSWNFDNKVGPCQGRCNKGGSLRDARFAATGMALLPFLGAGQTHKQGKYKDRVKAGLAYLVQRGKGGSYFEGSGTMYGHGICSIALCEAYAMTHDKYLFAPAQASINFICASQDPVGGGWRYAPKQAGDTSAVGWQIMALKSGHIGYLQVPPNVIAGASNFLNSVQADSGAGYGYTGPGDGQATSAIGLLCRMHLGWKREHPGIQRGVEKLSAWGPVAAKGGGNAHSANMYYNYYATQVLHHYEGEHWIKWNEKMRDFLIETQDLKGHAKGSWHFAGDHGGEAGGRLYCTAMAAMTLEVYYRHQPLYRNAAVDDDFEE